jgi:hypothetical protein
MNTFHTFASSNPIFMTQEQSNEGTKRKQKQQLPKLSGVKQQEQVIRTERWVHQETGEVRVFTVVDRSQTGDYGFHKVWLEDLGRIIGVLGGAKVKVFSYILNNINPVSNQVGGTIRELATILNLDTVTVQATIQILIKQGFMKRIRSGAYQVNAEVLVKGSHEKRSGLMISYDKLDSPSSEALYTSDNI